MTSSFKFWLDAHLSDKIAKFIEREFGFECRHIRTLGGRSLPDSEIFWKLRQDGNILLTKDSDFLEILLRFGPPPKIIWLTFGNTNNNRVNAILKQMLPDIVEKFQSGESLVEISGID